jgi:AAA domain
MATTNQMPPNAAAGGSAPANPANGNGTAQEPKPKPNGGSKDKNPPRRAVFHTAREWMKRPYRAMRSENFIIGTPQNTIVEPLTKNLVEAAEKSFKTTALLRLTMGMSGGVTVFPQLPVTKQKLKTLYLHGELGVIQLEERVISAAQGLPDECLDNFIQGRDLGAHLIKPEGQKAIRALVDQYKPDVLVIDPWQSFITGCDENSFKDVSLAQKFIDELISDFKVTVFIVVHLGKDHSKGARGHSSMMGWRDARIVLKLDSKSSTPQVTVKVSPRWGEPIEDFKLKFKNGTVWSSASFSPQNEQLREFLKARKGIAMKSEIRKSDPWKAMNDEAFRKALQRASKDGAIAAVTGDIVRLPSVKLTLGLQVCLWYLNATPGAIFSGAEIKKAADLHGGISSTLSAIVKQGALEPVHLTQVEDHRTFKVLDLSPEEREELLEWALHPPENDELI